MTSLYQLLAKTTMFATAACLALAIVAVPTNVKADENDCITACGDMPDAMADPKGYSSWVACVQSHSRECETLNKCFKECGTRPDPDRDPDGYAHWSDCIHVHEDCSSLLGLGCNTTQCRLNLPDGCGAADPAGNPPCPYHFFCRDDCLPDRARTKCDCW